MIHADKHGFLAIPLGEESHLLEAAKFMDRNECDHVIRASRSCVGLTGQAICEQIDEAAAAFSHAASEKFSRKGEW